MKKILFASVLVCLVTSLYAQEGYGTKESFVSNEWEIIQETSGDLNKDSLNDVAMITEFRGDALEGERPRLLIILLKDKETNLYKEACRSEYAILDGQSGGTMGDPLESMTIKNYVLIIKFSGGSREKWTTTHRYRWKDYYFTVIGATYQVNDMAVTNTYDYNLLNGNMILTTKDSKNKANNKTVNKTLKLTPIPLQDFEPDALWAIMNPKDYFVKTEQAILTDAGVGDCYHVFFGDQDFGNAETYLDEASEKLWNELSTNNENDETIVNPKYKGKKFEITYFTKDGLKCEPQGVDMYQVVIGFKLIP